MPTGIPTNRSNIELPTAVSTEIIQKAQEASAVMQLARQITLPGTGLTIPVITSDPEAEWVAETGAKPVKNPGLGKKVMQAYKLAVIVPFSNEFKRDAAALYDELVSRLPASLAYKFDSTVFHGSAPGSNFDTFAAVTAQSISGEGNSLYKALVAADADIAEHFGLLSGFALSPQGKSELLAAVDTIGRPLYLNSVAEGDVAKLLGVPVYYSRAAFKAGSVAQSAPDVLGIAGDWTQAMYGIVQGIDVSTSDQATLTTKDQSNNDVTINLWQQNMFAVRAEIEIGFRADTSCFNRIVRAVSGATGAT